MNTHIFGVSGGLVGSIVGVNGVGAHVVIDYKKVKLKYGECKHP